MLAVALGIAVTGIGLAIDVMHIVQEGIDDYDRQQVYLYRFFYVASYNKIEYLMCCFI